MSSTTTSAPPAAGTPVTGTSNATDVTFATDMIPHHAQSVEMADLTPTQASDPRVKAIAARIKKAQTPEIARLSGWLKAWGAAVPGSAGGHDMSGMAGMGSSGMMSSEQMTNLGKATRSAFDRMWLQRMTQHHEGAVASARTELTSGANPDAKRLAQSIIDSQSAEITEMKAALVDLPR